MGGARLLRELLDTHHQNIPLVLAAYTLSGGGGPVRRRTAFSRDTGICRQIVTLIANARSDGGELPRASDPRLTAFTFS
jgi:hypothetical protein